VSTLYIEGDAADAFNPSSVTCCLEKKNGLAKLALKFEMDDGAKIIFFGLLPPKKKSLASSDRFQRFYIATFTFFKVD